MPDPSNQPQSLDAIPGGAAPAPPQDATLGELEGIQQQLSSPDLGLRLDALNQAWKQGAAGRVYLEQALNDRSKTVRRRARWLLRQPEAARELPPALPDWTLTERLGGYPGYSGGHVTRFAGRTVQEGLTRSNPWQSPSQVAYALRCETYEDPIGIRDRLTALLDTPGSEYLEALVFGMWDDSVAVCTGESASQRLVELLVSERARLPNLKALFIGDIVSEESEISWLVQSDLSPLLQAFPQLELLQARGGMGLQFTPTDHPTHEHLQALILETGGLSRETVHQVYAWNFPALQHLELWFGSEHYGGDCWEQDLAPMLNDLKFPHLTYLGLRNSQFADDLIDRLVQSPLLAGLQVLDLSMGTLSDTGAARLLDCPAIADLDILNVSENYLSDAMIEQLQALDLQLLADGQRTDEEEEEGDRYCAVAE